jgi:hypothetical protein
MSVAVTETMLDAGLKTLTELQPMLLDFVPEAEIKQDLGRVFKAMYAVNPWIPPIPVAAAPASAPVAE